MIHVLIADDHPIVRHGLVRLIQQQPDMTVVGEAADGAEVVGLLDATRPDVLVLDLSLPHIRGLELVHLVRERHPDVRVLIFSVQPEDQLSLHLLDAGVSGYLSKDHGVDGVVNAVRTVARGRRFLTDALARLAAEGTRGAPHDRLTARERQVFDLLVSGMGAGAIADELEISASTAANHLAHIREKLGVASNAEVLRYAARTGLM